MLDKRIDLEKLPDDVRATLEWQDHEARRTAFIEIAKAEIGDWEPVARVLAERLATHDTQVDAEGHLGLACAECDLKAGRVYTHEEVWGEGAVVVLSGGKSG